MEKGWESKSGTQVAHSGKEEACHGASGLSEVPKVGPRLPDAGPMRRSLLLTLPSAPEVWESLCVAQGSEALAGFGTHWMQHRSLVPSLPRKSQRLTRCTSATS